MAVTIPELFEDGYLRIFSESIKNIGSAATASEIDTAVAAAQQALARVKDTHTRARSEQQLLLLMEMAYKRVGGK